MPAPALTPLEEEDEEDLQAIPDISDTISSPSQGTCGEWCWKVDLAHTNVSCTDICVSKDIGGPAVKVFVTGHGKVKLVSALVHNKRGCLLL